MGASAPDANALLQYPVHLPPRPQARCSLEEVAAPKVVRRRLPACLERRHKQLLSQPQFVRCFGVCLPWLAAPTARRCEQHLGLGHVLRVRRREKKREGVRGRAVAVHSAMRESFCTTQDRAQGATFSHFTILLSRRTFQSHRIVHQHIAQYVSPPFLCSLLPSLLRLLFSACPPLCSSLVCPSSSLPNCLHRVYIYSIYVYAQ